MQEEYLGLGSESVLLSEVRRGVADIMEIEGMHYLDADAIFARYEELMAEKEHMGIVVKTARILPVQQQLWSLEEAI